MSERFQWEVRPVAVQSNIVEGEKYRFTVLESRLLRLEYAENGIFEDRASQVVFYRDFPACTYEAKVSGGVLTLETEALVLTYQVDAPFSQDSLQIRLKIEPAASWCYGEDFETLGGTTRTLDQVDGRCGVGDGVCSRNGFSVINDSDSLLLESDGWIGTRRGEGVDCYFFGFGFDYIGAVQALYKLTGAPPLLPAYALGNWWSRYYAYTQQEYLDLMDRFRQENIPFTVGVVDMDWHVTEIPEDKKVESDPRVTSGWTGYSWNRELFPDYRQFLKELHKRHLKTALNLHPAVGTCCHEDMYLEMAKANGIDPATNQRVPLDLLSKKHMETYFDILHHPYEKDGVDFWWMDWQQGTDYWWIHEPNQPGEYQDPRERMDPLWLLNHLHILDISRSGKRPMFFSRFANPGSHRYPVGFSGDTTVSWDSLNFQPEFTATSSNIGYCWWSHDIGGHMLGIHDHQLYTRWLQLGVLSPINRLHSTKQRFMNKEPWNYPQEIADIAGKWLRLRHSLFPYLYTMNYRTHTKLLPLVQPMYYSHPKCHEAYKVPNQFWFGSELMVAPITQPNDPVAMVGQTEVWLPKGKWFDFFTGMHYDGLGGRRMEVFRPLDKAPVFAKAGAIVPLACYAPGDNCLTNPEQMQVLVFPGAENAFSLYEDAGEGYDFRCGGCAQTLMELKWGEQPEFVIHPASGDRSLIPQVRQWRIGLRGFHRGICVEGGVWEPETNTLWVTVTAGTDETVRIRITADELIHDNCDAVDRCEEILRRSQDSHYEKEQLWQLLSQPTLRDRMTALRCSGRTTAKAMEELLILTEDPYGHKKG